MGGGGEGYAEANQCIANRRSNPPLHRQTVKFGVKGRTGPSPRVARHVRRAGAGLGEGGGALHTDPVLTGQVLVIWGCGRKGGGRREGGGRGRTHRPHGDFIADAVAPAGGWWCTWWGVGTAEEGGAGQGGQGKEGRKSAPPTPVHHTYRKGPDFLVLPPRCGCRRAALAVWCPPQCPCACSEEGVGSDRATARPPAMFRSRV